MVARNSVTGDKIQTKGISDAYRNNYDAVFGKKEEKELYVEEAHMEGDNLVVSCSDGTVHQFSSRTPPELESGCFYVVVDIEDGDITVAQWVEEYGSAWWFLVGTDEEFSEHRLSVVRKIDLV